MRLGIRGTPKRGSRMGLTDWIERAFVTATIAQTAYALYVVLREVFMKTKEESTITSVLFFPDQELLRQMYQRTLDVRNPEKQSIRQHQGLTALEVIVRNIKNAKQSVDVCVFTITCYELARAVVDAHARGVIVRVVTDNEHLLSTGSQVAFFRHEGIQVRHDDSSFFMHHKFVIIDRKTLINGSFNWTRNAVTGNRENVMIVEGGEVTQKYNGEFERLWHEFNPELR